MLCPTEFDETDQQALFKPFAEAVPIFTKIKDLLTEMVTLGPTIKVNSVTCSSKSPDGTDYGTGAVWSVNLASLVRRKHGSVWIPAVYSYTIQENLGTQIKLVQERESRGASKVYPTTVVVTLSENGTDSVVNTQMLTTLPALHELNNPMICCLCPQFYIMGVLCQPCCYLCVLPKAKEGVAKQCSQINKKMKDLAENGPAAEAMVDTAPLLAQMQAQQIQMQQMQQMQAQQMQIQQMQAQMAQQQQQQVSVPAAAAAPPYPGVVSSS